MAFLDTGQVLRRIENGRLHPRTPFELSSAIVSALTRREIDLIATLAKQSGDLERQLMLGAVSHDPEPFLEELFKTWYELLAIRTIAVHSAATYDRMAKLVRSLPETERPLVATSRTASTRSAAWPTVNANSCTASSNSSRPAPAPT